MEDNASFEISLKGTNIHDGKVVSVDERYDQAHAVVVLLFRQHNAHTIVQQGMIIGGFKENYYTAIIRELINSWGLWKVIKATVRAALNLLPYSHVP